MSTGPTTLAVLVALLGAACYAAGAALQHQQASAVPAGTTLRPTLLLRLARQPRWLIGGVANAAGAGLHVIALTLAPLAVVQPIGVMTIVFAVPSAALLTRRRPSKLELTGAVVASVGLVLLVTAIRSPRAAPVLGFSEVVPVACGLVLLLGGIALAVRLLRGVTRSIVLAAAGGVAFGVMSAIMRPALTDLGDRGLAGLVSWSVLAVAVLAVVGVLLEQSAFQTGRLAIAIAVVVITDPLASIVFGATLFHQPVGIDGFGFAVGGTALVLVGISVLALKRSPAPPGGGDPTAADDVHGGSTDTAEAGAAERAETSRLRVLIGTDDYLPHVGGIEYFTHRLAHGLAARGHEVHIICPSSGWRGREEDDGPVRVHRLASIPTLVERNFWFASPLHAGDEIEGLVAEIRPDVVHVQGHYIVGRALCALAKRTGLPLVATNHFMPENLPAYLALPGPLARAVASLLWRDVARVYAPAAAVTTPTPRAAHLIRTAGGLLDVEAVSNGVDLTRFDTAPAAPAAPGPVRERRTMLYVGRLVAEKHVHELIDALPSIRAEADARLVIAGTGPLRDTLRRRAAALGVAEHVEFLGYVPDDDLPALYAEADVFCMPGTAELQSLVLLEAMASGRPVVAADAMALPHLCRNRYNGFLHDPHDVAGIATAVTRILTDDELRVRMGAASRALAAEHGQDRTLERYEQIYVAAGAAPLPARAPRRRAAAVVA